MNEHLKQRAAMGLLEKVKSRSPLDWLCVKDKTTKRWEHTKKLNRLALRALFDEDGPEFLALSMPPRHGKSQLFSIALPGWIMETFPGTKVALATYEADFAASWGRRVRDLIDPSLIDPTSRAADRLLLKNGSSLHTTGVGGPLTGRGFHLIIIDDPIKNAEEAMSATIRQRLYDWCISTVFTRREPAKPPFVRSPVIHIATRWHHDDLIGRMADLWEWHNFPALDESDEALCPERFTAEELKALRDRDPYWFSALYQGQPMPARETLFVTPFPIVHEEDEGYSFARREDMVRFATVDLASSAGAKADWTVIGTWDYHPATGRLVLHHLARQRISAYDHVGFIQSNIRPFTTWVGIENISFGVPLIQTLRQQSRVPIRPLNPKGDKMARAMPAIEWAKDGRILVSDRVPEEVRREFFSELAQFPVGTHDDQVDVLSYAVLTAMNLPYMQPYERKHLSREERIWQALLKRRQNTHPVLGKW